MRSLKEFATPEHRAFFGKLVPGCPVLGVKKAGIQSFLHAMSPEEKTAFLASLPHAYVEENQAHMYLLNEIRDFDEAVEKLEQFLPYINSWSETDILNIRAFGPDARTEAYALNLLRRSEPYAVRVGMLILKRHFLRTRPHLPEILAVDTTVYTLSMMTGWYLAEVAVSDPETVLALLDGLDTPTRKRTIQKVVDSRRIPIAVKDRFKEKRKGTSVPSL